MTEDVVGSENPRVLVVDDEPSILEAIDDLLESEFDVITAASGEEAVRLLNEQAVAVILADQRMPGMKGTELVVRAAQLQPDATRILLTGYSDIEAIVGAINEGGVYQYVTKPWDPTALLNVLRRGAERHRLLVENHRIVEEMAGEPETSRRLGALASSAGELERAILKRDNERLRLVLEHFRNSFWHLEKLQELLTICMTCGQVRDERGEWLNLAAFLQRHAAFLSHGYCPTCAAKLEREFASEE